jgi:tetratricopeptide (TPR) repeat protein
VSAAKLKFLEPHSVSANSIRIPLLDRFYRQYLDDEISSRFIKHVSQHYTIETLERLAADGQVVSRRGAVLALGFLGSFRSNEVLGLALHDSDRAVRLLAEHGIRELWFRDGDPVQQRQLQKIAHLNQSQKFDEANQLANQLIESAPQIAEIWNQRGIALFNMEQYEDSLIECQQAIHLNPYHFSAIVGKGHCFLNLEMTLSAMECFAAAIEIHPGLDSVRAHLQHLKKTI